MTSNGSEPLRDTGRAPKIANEREHMNAAHVFDTLVTSNIQLVKTLRVAIFVMVVCGFMGTMMTIYSAVAMRIGQTETRELITALSRSRCSDNRKE